MNFGRRGSTEGRCSNLKLLVCHCRKLLVCLYAVDGAEIHNTKLREVVLRQSFSTAEVLRVVGCPHSAFLALKLPWLKLGDTLLGDRLILLEIQTVWTSRSSHSTLMDWEFMIPNLLCVKSHSESPKGTPN